MVVRYLVRMTVVAKGSNKNTVLVNDNEMLDPKLSSIAWRRGALV